MPFAHPFSGVRTRFGGTIVTLLNSPRLRVSCNRRSASPAAAATAASRENKWRASPCTTSRGPKTAFLSRGPSHS